VDGMNDYTTLSGKLARMRNVNKWSCTWKDFTVEPGATGKIVGHHDTGPFYAVEWPGHSVVWVEEEHVDVLLPGDIALEQSQHGSRMFK
jgi:hypothetical protein